MANSQIMNIPEELKALPQWHVWKSVNGTKVPLQVNGQPAKANDPDTWTTYDEASAAASGRPMGSPRIGHAVKAAKHGTSAAKTAPSAAPNRWIAKV